MSDHENNQVVPSVGTPDMGRVARLFNDKGMFFIVRDEPARALHLFHRALTLSPGNPVVLNNRGNALLNLGRLDEAAQSYRQALDADANYPKPHRNLALLYQLQGRSAEAIAAYRCYLERVPEDGQAHHNLGLLYVSEGMMDEATVAFEAAARYLLPDDAETATKLGVGAFYQGHLKEAIRYCERALSFDAAYVPAQYHLGITYLFLGRCDEAIATLEAVVVRAPDHPQAIANLGVAYSTAGQPAKAVTLFETLLWQEPDNPSHHLNLGLACMEAGLVERAEACLRRVLDLCEQATPHSLKARQALDDLQIG